jgi:SSS family transporter
MNSYDITVCIAYFILIIGIGIVAKGKNHTTKDFYLAGRSMNWFPVGLSVMITVFSAINFVAVPKEVAVYGLYVITALPVFILVAIPITRYFIPRFYRLGSVSAYEFLEECFDVKVRCLASGMFIFWRMLWMAVILFATAKILALVTGISLPVLIIICGAVAMAYTAIGGIRAVIWTDVAQFMVLFGGLVTIIVVTIAGSRAGFSGILETTHGQGLLKPFSPFDAKFFSPDPTIRISFFSCLIGVFVAFLTRYGADQIVIQRYSAAKSLRAAQTSFWWNVICAIVSIALLGVFGLVLFNYASEHNLLTAHNTLKAPLKVIKAIIISLPYGGCGLLVAGLLAATMSSIDSGINACSAAWFSDFHQRFFEKEPETCKDCRYSIYLTLTIGCLSILLALLCMRFLGHSQTIFVMINKVIHGLGSPLLAVMLLAMFTKRVSPAAVFRGTLLGFICSILTVTLIHGLALHYYAVLNLLITLSLCLAFNVFKKQR